MFKFSYIPLSLLVASLLGGCVAAEDETEDDVYDTQEPVAQLDREATTDTGPTAEAAAELLSSWDEQMYTDDSNPGGRVRFETYGDIVEVCDIQADGKPVDLYYYNWHVHVGSGNGTCVTTRKSNGFDLPESRSPYKFIICLNYNEWCDEAWWENDD